MEWQPIETAPKEPFTTILAYDLDLGVCLAYWAPADEDGPELGWMAQDTIGEYCGDLTHWMPLPAPPQ